MSVALLFNEQSYATGISNTETLFQSEYPTSMLHIEEYVVDEGQPTSVDTALDDYFSKFPEGNRATLSEKTAILLLIADYLERKGIVDVLCLTVSTTTNVIQQLPYALSYAPPLSLQVKTQMLVIRDYGIQNVQILFQENSPNSVFLTQYREALVAQCTLLGIPSRVTVLGDSLHFSEHSAIVILADTAILPLYFTHEVLASIPDSSYLALTNLNYDVGGIFQPATAFVFLIAPIDYTTTSQQIQSVVESNFIFYGVYGAYDTLLTLNVLLQSGRAFNVEEYTTVSVDAPLAYSNGGFFDLTLHAIPYGNYDIVFTENVLLKSPRLLDTFLKSTSGGLGISSLRDSYSVFRTAGMVPFFSNGYYYVLQNLSKIYRGRNHHHLLAVKFEKNLVSFSRPGTTGQEGVVVNVSEAIPNRFYSAVDPVTGLFSILERIYECIGCPPRVNRTMSKKTDHFYIPIPS
jgi:hypothetical protein